MKTIAIIQARTGSHRLKNKVFADICGKPMLQRVVERVSLAELDGLVVATSFAEEDYQIVRWCQDNQIPVMRGGLSVDDVLGRYWDVATLIGADVIVRVTADCPLVDPDLIHSVLKLLGDDVQYASNVTPRTFPDGLDVEAFTLEALMLAHQNTVFVSLGDELESRIDEARNDREHVTPWMRRNLRTDAMVNDEDLSALRWTVDTQDDLEFVRTVYANLEEGFRWRDVLNWQRAR